MSMEFIPEAFARHLPPASDRMLTTWFLALLLHGIVILGVSFSGDASPKPAAAPMLEVMLVDEQTPKLKANPRAKYVAQRSQHGSGNTTSRERALIPSSSAHPIDQPGFADAGGRQFRAAGSTSPAELTLSTTGASTRMVYYSKADSASARAEAPELLRKRDALGIQSNEDDEHLRLQGQSHGELWITAETRESSVAVYLDAWRRKVEHVGTLNFPRAVQHRHLSGTPVIEVAIDSQGRLTESFIRRSSGSPDIDRAALAILKLASPYEPFPHLMRQAHDSIRFAYEWQFLQGSAKGSGVLLDADPN